VKNCRKCSASDSESSESKDNDSSDEGSKKHRQIHKKVKTVAMVDEEEDVEQGEVEIEIVDSAESGNEEPEDERWGFA